MQATLNFPDMVSDRRKTLKKEKSEKIQQQQ